MKANRLKNIIELETEINVDIVSRKRNFVEARALYYNLLRDVLGMTLQSIADTVKKNHATVLHSINNFDILLSYNEDMKKSYSNIICMISHYNSRSMDNSEIGRLRYNNTLLSIKVNELTDNIALMRNVSRLHELIDRVPAEKEELMYERISAIVRMNC